MPTTSANDIDPGARHHHTLRLKRFAKYLERWCRGEPVRTYDTRWLAYLQEHLPDPRHRKSKIG